MGFCNGIENYSRILDGRMPGRPALLPARLLPRRLRLLPGREPPDRPADRRDARGRPLAQADARRLRVPAAQRAGQPPADLRRVPRRSRRRSCSSRRRRASTSARHSKSVVEQIVRPTGIVDPAVEVRETRNQIDDLMNEIRVAGRQGRARPGHDAHEEDERGPDGLPARDGLQGPLPALGGRHPGAHPDHPRPAAGRVRRARRRQPPARGPRPPRGVARRRSSTPTRRASCAGRPP